MLTRLSGILLLEHYQVTRRLGKKLVKTYEKAYRETNFSDHLPSTTPFSSILSIVKEDVNVNSKSYMHISTTNIYEY